MRSKYFWISERRWRLGGSSDSPEQPSSHSLLGPANRHQSPESAYASSIPQARMRKHRQAPLGFIWPTKWNFLAQNPRFLPFGTCGCLHLRSCCCWQHPKEGKLVPLDPQAQQISLLPVCTFAAPSCTAPCRLLLAWPGPWAWALARLEGNIMLINTACMF